MQDLRLPDGRERLVRHGYGPERLVQTGIGPVPVRRVKLRDRGAGPEGERIRFDEHHEVRFQMFVTQLTRDPASGQTRTQVIWPAELANTTLRLPSP